MVLVAIAMVAIIAIAALSIDLITLYLAREEAQRAADAAALTAARIISISGITGTADPGNQQPYWQSICGGPASVATQAAQAVGGQNAVGGIGGTVTVTYAAGGASPAADCSTLPTAFAVNPLITVQIQRATLPTFFSRIWGNAGNSVSATATAEVLNPSASDVNTNGGPTGAVTPVQPRCVKPWIVPNEDPQDGSCTVPGCPKFVSLSDGSISNPGITLGGGSSNGVIGESFNLFADCGTATNCLSPPTPQPQANATGGGFTGGVAPAAPNLEYLPGDATSVSSVAVPACGNSSNYQAAVAGCDQTTIYQCGTPAGNSIDLTENPGGPTGDTATGLACSLTNQSGPPLVGQDVLDTTTAYPFKLTAGAANPTKIASGTAISASNSIVSLPIVDTPLTITGNHGTVTVVGFLQVFVNSIDANGIVNVTVLNVAGCGNGSTTPNPPVSGSSPVPVRLITPP